MAVLVTSRSPYHGLLTLPFRENTDPNFLWLGPPNRDAYTALRAAVLENAGVLLLTGDIGTGKTMLAGAIAESLRAEGVRVEKLLHSDLSAHEFRHGVAEAFALPTHSNVRATFFEQFAEFLEAVHARGEKVLLVIDEAQGFGTVLLDEIEDFVRAGRVAGKDEVNVMNILLVSHADIDADVIAVRAHLTPLEPRHVPDYIAFRLRVAGGDRELFSDDAIREIAAMSGGVPRVINRVCDCALQIAADRNEAVVSAEIVREVPDALGFTTVANDAIVGVDERPRTRATMKRIAYLAAGIVLVAAGAFAYQGLGSLADWKPRAAAPPSAPTLGASRATPAGPSGGEAGAALPQVSTEPGARPERAAPDVRAVSVPAESRETAARPAPTPAPAVARPAPTPAVEARPALPAPAVEARPTPPAPAPAVDARAAQPAPARRPASAPVAAATPATSPVTTGPQGASPPAAARGGDESHDPAAIINWLLQRKGEEKR